MEPLTTDEIIEEIASIIEATDGSDILDVSIDIWNRLLELNVVKNFQERSNGPETSS